MSFIQFFLVMNLAIGGTAYFPDDSTNPGGKPWSNESPVVCFFLKTCLKLKQMRLKQIVHFRLILNFGMPEVNGHLLGNWMKIMVKMLLWLLIMSKYGLLTSSELTK
jgi:hypothetical protein